LLPDIKEVALQIENTLINTIILLVKKVTTTEIILETATVIIAEVAIQVRVIIEEVATQVTLTTDAVPEAQEITHIHPLNLVTNATIPM